MLEYDPSFNKFRIINRTEIESSEFTFDKAVKKIIDMNAIYNPSYIYIRFAVLVNICPLYRK